MVSGRDGRVSEGLGSPTGILSTMPNSLRHAGRMSPQCGRCFRLVAEGRGSQRQSQPHSHAELGDAAADAEPSTTAHRLPYRCLRRSGLSA